MRETSEFRDTICGMSPVRFLVPVLLIAFAVLLCAQTLIVSPSEITCNSTTQALGTSGIARWILFIPPTTNSAVVRVGASNVGATTGLPIAAGGGLLWPPISGAPGYDLTKLYYYCTTGDKLDFAWAK